MPERGRQAIRRLAAGLMLLAVLMLSAAQGRFEASGYAHHAHAAHHHLVVHANTGSSSAPCSDQRDHHGHTLACCVASCTVASPIRPTEPFSATIPSGNAVVYRVVASSDLVGVIPDPASRPPERVG